MVHSAASLLLGCLLMQPFWLEPATAVKRRSVASPKKTGAASPQTPGAASGGPPECIAAQLAGLEQPAAVAKLCGGALDTSACDAGTIEGVDAMRRKACGGGGGGGPAAPQFEEPGTHQIPWAQLARLAPAAPGPPGLPLAGGDPLGLPEGFWGRHWGREAVVVRRGAGALRPLMDWDRGDVALLLRDHEFELGRNGKFVLDGRRGRQEGARLTIEEVRAKYAMRATIAMGEYVIK